MSQRHLFCFGLGYSALALARVLKADGWRVAGTCRTEGKQADLRKEGIDARLFDRGRPLADPDAMAGSAFILSSVPPDAAGDPVLDHHAADLARLEGIEWVGYLSTTGVYGDRGGDWVDETSPRNPGGERGRRRLAAEDGWLRLWDRAALPVHLFRLAGIYGPGRSALDALRQGAARRVIKPGQVFSRIHVEDIVAVLRASMRRPHPGAAYNVCDDDPSDPAAVIEHAAALLGMDPPPAVPFESAELSPMARSFYADSKRVRNDRIKSELGVRLRHPDYRAGLAALLAAERDG